MMNLILSIIALIVAIAVMAYTIHSYAYNSGWWDCYLKIKKNESEKDEALRECVNSIRQIVNEWGIRKEHHDLYVTLRQAEKALDE